MCLPGLLLSVRSFIASAESSGRIWAAVFHFDCYYLGHLGFFPLVLCGHRKVVRYVVNCTKISSGYSYLKGSCTKNTQHVFSYFYVVCYLQLSLCFFVAVFHQGFIHLFRAVAYEYFF